MSTTLKIVIIMIIKRSLYVWDIKIRRPFHIWMCIFFLKAADVGVFSPQECVTSWLVLLVNCDWVFNWAWLIEFLQIVVFLFCGFPFHRSPFCKSELKASASLCTPLKHWNTCISCRKQFLGNHFLMKCLSLLSIWMRAAEPVALLYLPIQFVDVKMAAVNRCDRSHQKCSHFSRPDCLMTALRQSLKALTAQRRLYN